MVKVLDPIELVDVAADSGPTIVTITDSINSQSIPYDSTTMGQGRVINIPAGTFNYGYQGGTGPATVIREVQQSTVNPLDSNDTSIARGVVTQPVNTAVDAQTGKLTFTGAPKGGSFATNAAYFLTSVNQAVLATQVGIALGKGFDEYLYNSNPDYWDSLGMSSLNPETWGSLTYDDDSLGASLFNMIFGIDPVTGNAQAYADAEAFAYMAQVLNQAGLLSSVATGYVDSSYIEGSGNTTYYYGVGWNQPIVYSSDYECYSASSMSDYQQGKIDHIRYSSNGNGVFTNYVPVGRTATVDGIVYTYDEAGYYISKTNDIITGIVTTYTGNVSTRTYTCSSVTSKGTNETIYFWHAPTGSARTRCVLPYINLYNGYIGNSGYEASDLYNFWVRGTFEEPVPGVETQNGARVPNTQDWSDLENVANSLRLQYPELFTGALTYDVPDAQGNIIEKTYVPVAWPNTTTNPWTDNQPTTDIGTQTQLQTIINLLTEPATRTQTVTDTLTQPVNTSPTGTVPPAENPTDTGSGSSPVPVSTSGSSSKLWSVYHPTQGQVDAFGAWLWSTNFIDQIMKMFQNPMEGIISLHKVFATPIDAGTGNIVVGTLDSGVSSATVTQQYVYVSCGSVDCHEDFGNVFDYSPHTQVSLYLPFIGIVPLDVSDVMRSTITVDYGVDMFTGACLAMVKVSRDNATVNMYQYAGSASVEYPLSNVQQSQLLSGILAVAAGGAAIATGGMSMAAGAAVIGGAANAMKSNVGRSGGFSGNAGAMGIKKPYIIIQRPQTKVASLFPRLSGYPTNISGKLSDFSGQVNVTDVHVEGIPATDYELKQIEELLHMGVLV